MSGVHRELQLPHDSGGNCILELEHIADMPVIGLRPLVHAGSGIDQLGGYSYLVAGTAYAAFEYVTSVQLRTDRSQVGILAFELKRRCAADDRKTGNLGQ